MTLRDLRNVFENGTLFFMYSAEDEDEYLEINNMLWGTDVFAGMSVAADSICTGKYSINIKTDMPIAVLNEWKKYAGQY